MSFSATKQPEEAQSFYADVLGLSLVPHEPMALVFDAFGVMLRISIVDDFTPQPFTILGWQVTDIRRTLAELKAKGVSFEHYAFPGQDAAGIWTAPDGTQVAWFKDPDGNLLSLTQFPT
jgi:catechol 2,3-dioxygenase-like lactoylglutathione lyase family enzyme